MFRNVLLVAVGAAVAGWAFYKLYYRHAVGSAKAGCWTVGVLGTALVLWAGHNMVVTWLTAEM